MIKKLMLTGAVLCLTGCTVGPDYATPSQSFLDKWFSSETKATSPEPINTAWWTIFEDPLLEKYVEIAAENNKDLKIALANIRIARATRRESSGAFWPQIGGNADADRSKSSGAASSFNGGEIRNTYDASFDASWEIDIFGGNRRAMQASNSRIDVSIASYQDVMLSTLSDVARTYYEARGLQKRIAITEQNTQLLKETFVVIQDRLKAGEASEFDLSRAQGEYELTRARIPNLQAELRASLYSLSVLLGQPPETLLAEMQSIKPLPTPPDIVPVGLRSEILRRRPDIKVAESEFAASVADIGVETAELFPKFFLTGDIGSSARTFGDVFSAGSALWSLASMIQWSVFEGGAIRARIDVEEAESQAALASYEKSVLEALRDAESALTRYGEELETRKRLAQGIQSRRKSLSLAKQLFNAGEQDYLAVVDAERQLIDSVDDLIISETNSITKLISLYTALGGGWEHF
jgi:multidrug efflux system outer membrane protein